MQKNLKSDERVLWCAVVKLALDDLHHYDRRIRQSAYHWFFEDFMEFQWVCALADLNPDYIRDKAKKIVKTSKKIRPDELSSVLKMLRDSNSSRTRAIEKAIQSYMLKNRPEKEIQNEN